MVGNWINKAVSKHPWRTPKGYWNKEGSQHPKGET